MSPWRVRLRFAFWYVLLWTVTAVLWTVTFGAQAGSGAINWPNLFARAALSVYTDALVFLPLVFLIWTVPWPGKAPLRLLTIYLSATAAVAAVRFVIFVPLHNRFFGSDWTIAGDIREQVLPEFMGLCGAAAIVWGMRYFRDAKEREIREARLSNELSLARLQALQSQIHPHFLFNTLNGISTLMHRDVMLADEMLSRLCDLLRLTLYLPQNGEVQLSYEIEILRRYMEIMEMRFPKRAMLRIDVPEQLQGLFIPALLLQPLVENVLRHGLDTDRGTVEIVVAAARTAEEISISVSDNGKGLNGNAVRFGVGLENISRRLCALYGERGTIQIHPGLPSGTNVEIRIPDPEAG